MNPRRNSDGGHGVGLWEVRTVKDPSGRPHLLKIRARGVADPNPLGLGVMLWLLSWIVHAVRFREQWLVEVHAPAEPGVSLRKRLEKPTWVYDGYTSRREANAGLNKIAELIEAGMWVPQSKGT